LKTSSFDALLTVADADPPFELTDAARRADEALLRMAPAARDELARAAQAGPRRWA
jgi:hypothetical protein